MVRIKRAYEPASAEDGYRILVDRLWPRGVSKEAARVDLWAKELAPSPGLRVWFGHDPRRFRDFAERYRLELSRSPARELFVEVLHRAAHGTVTLVYGAHDEVHNNAAVLKRELDDALGDGASAD
jgi:uncharacterized protein YeaO (DUF488 family)